MPPRGKIRPNVNARKLSGKEVLKIFGRILKTMIKGYPIHFVCVILCILMSSAAGAVGSYFVGSILINGFIAPNLPGAINTQTGIYYNGKLVAPMTLEVAILLMMSVYLLGVISAFLYQILTSQIGQGTQKKIRDQLFAHMEKLPISYFDRRTHGDIMSVYTNDIDTLREMISRVLPMCVQSIITMIFAFTMMCISSSRILIIVVAIFFFLIVFTVLSLSKKSSYFFIGQQRALGKTNGYIEEMISGQKVIKVFNHEREAEEGFDELNEELCKYATKAGQFSNIMGPVTNNLGNFMFVVLAVTGGILYANKFPGILVGDIVSFVLLGKQFVMPIGQLSMNINMFIMAMAGAQRIYELMDVPVEADEGYVRLVNAKEGENGEIIEVNEKTNKWAWKHPHKDGRVTYTWLKGKINFYNVDFAYVKGKTVLHDITMYAEPGQKVAFVGPTGAGKTTITNLLNRFYDIEDGKVRFDDININKIVKSDLRRAMGMVLQETNLFTDTVRENIRYGNVNATDEDIIEAAKLANAHNFIMMLPNGYDTVLEGAGAGLSQGQRQLISIARAACANPPVLILDEATSSIDSRTEKLVQQGMDAIMKGRTVFVIAHRLSTITNSDVIMVLEDGRIIERGNHQQLLEQKGKYYQLYTGSKIE